MTAEGAKNVLEVLSQFSPNVKGKKDAVDLSKTYTTAFVSKVAPCLHPICTVRGTTPAPAFWDHLVP